MQHPSLIVTTHTDIHVQKIFTYYKPPNSTQSFLFIQSNETYNPQHPLSPHHFFFCYSSPLLLSALPDSGNVTSGVSTNHNFIRRCRRSSLQEDQCCDSLSAAEHPFLTNQKKFGVFDTNFNLFTCTMNLASSSKSFEPSLSITIS